MLDTDILEFTGAHSRQGPKNLPLGLNKILNVDAMTPIEMNKQSE